MVSPKPYQLVAIIVLFICKLHAIVCVSTGNGNWGNATTWSSGTVPSCGDSVIIAVGHTVTIAADIDNSACGTKMSVTLRGIIQFLNTRWKMPCNSRIYVFGGGSIHTNGGGGNSNTIEICGNLEWNAGTGNFDGPGCLPTGLAGCGKVLPVQLVDFIATRNDNGGVTLRWKTAMEKNLSAFVVERSKDGIDFVSVCSQAPRSAGTNCQSPNIYEAFDEHAPEGLNYYRLRTEDLDGSYELSSLVVVSKNESMVPISFFPNPCHSAFTIMIPASNRDSEITISLRDHMGVEVFKICLPRNLNLDTRSVSIPMNISPGVYLRELSTGSHSWVDRMIVVGP